jgi:hypothetical protein
MAHVYQNPEEKLWYVIKHYHGQSSGSTGNQQSNRNGLRLEKNDIVKFGRVRLRVRDIDYAEKDPEPPQLQIFNQRGSTASQRRPTQDQEMIAPNNSQGQVDINDI